MREQLKDEIIADFLKREWTPSYVRHMSYQKIRFYRYGYWKGIPDRFGCKIGFEIGRVRDGNFLGYFERKQIEASNQWLERNFTDPEFVRCRVRGLADTIERNYETYLTFVRAIPHDLQVLSNPEIIGLINEIYKKDEPLSTDMWTLFDTTEIPLISAARALLARNGYSSEQADSILVELSRPIKIIPVEREKSELLEFALLKGNKYEDELDRHVAEFAYMPMYDMYYEPYDRKHFEDRIDEIRRTLTPEQIKEEVESIRSKYDKNREISEKILVGFKSHETLSALLEFFVGYSYLKDRKPYTRDTASFHFRRVFEEIARRIGRTLYQTLYLDTEELMEALNGGVVVRATELDARAKNSVYFCRDSDIINSRDPKVLKRVDEILAKTEDQSEIAGTKAFGGKAKGRVIKILSNADFGKFKRGNVLVTSATRPDFIPIMKQAGAVVADEGGILSHAAIVSRELGIPCIVGTRFATKVFKDGDLVEVDADTGVVRVIKKNS